MFEPIITLGKEPTLANKRLAFNRLRDREMVVKLFDELGPRYKTRNGGYLRILKFGFRVGDNAPMALVELVDRPEPSEVPDAALIGPGARRPPPERSARRRRVRGSPVPDPQRRSLRPSAVVLSDPWNRFDDRSDQAGRRAAT